MEPALKRAKITDHFRVALKPQDVNIQKSLKRHRKNQDGGKENILLITIDDDDDDDADDKRQQQQQHQQQPLQSLSQQQPPNLLPQQQQHKQTPAKGETSPTSQQQSINLYLTPLGIKPSVVDYDRSLIDEPAFEIYHEPYYANDSFIYDKEQEIKYRSRRYFGDHGQSITPQLRARLVDWLVHLQDSFSLYHESLYMAVKLADQYLMRKSVAKAKLQLLYMTCLLIADKFDDRPPNVEIAKLLEETENKYTRKQIIGFERDILKTLNFNINFPLAFGFLRRFARCTRSNVRTLTLARYILENTLLDDEMIEELESKLAAASLLLAYQMLHLDKDWDDTAEFYTGYTQEDLTPLSMKLNNVISRPVDERISTIRTKYSHSIFLSVANVPPLDTSKLAC